jgi:hypothetical protein
MSCFGLPERAVLGRAEQFDHHELVFVFKHGRAPNRNNIELGRFGRNRTNVWEYASPSSFARPGEEGNLLAMHPTVKPRRIGSGCNHGRVGAERYRTRRLSRKRDHHNRGGAHWPALLWTRARLALRRHSHKSLADLYRRQRSPRPSGRTFSELAGDAEVQNGK